VEDVLLVELGDALPELPILADDGHRGKGNGARLALSREEDAMTEVAEAPVAGKRGEIKRISHWIGGKLVEGTSGRSGPVYNPATGEQTGEVDFASPEELARAVQAAKEAFPAWRALSLSRKTELFFRIRELVHDRSEEIAKFLTSEHGKVLSDAKGEVARGLEVIEFCCGIPELLKGDFSEQASSGIDVYSIRQPLGVAAGITPFNFPAMVPMWMWAPALACGNTFVLKPSEKDPSASIYVAELLKEAGVPDGVFNVVHGDKVAVDAILEHPDIASVSFVGSTPIAKYVYENATKRGKRCQALGGAKNHMIVLPDADIDMAADAAVSAAYGSAGERCMAISQVVAVGAVADRLIDAIKERIPKVKVGDGMQPDSEMGPLVTREHRDKVASYVENAPGEGATVVVDGRESAPQGNGFWLGVSLLDNLTPEMKAYQDEIFGPVLGVARVDTYDEALRLVNENPYGNGTAIFTRDGGVARQFQFDVQVGMVGINVPIPVPVAYYSFGGWKNSLFGDQHIYGPEGIQFYTRGKVVTSRWPDPATSKVDLGFPQTR
jgi:malonate-semialdehyde dehydrogenase (acetylating)/methylmalonate-semialdehyde dehydrogenase